MTVQQIINLMIKKTGMEPLPVDKTCDRLITGNPDMEVKKIASTFMATVDMIRKAIDKNVNFIITHEPTWFTGMDSTEWIQSDPVYLEKKRLLEEHQIAVWRFHDHMHMGTEDGIYRGFDLETGWAKYRIPNPEDLKGFCVCYEIPETTIAGLADFFKKCIGMEVVQIVGDPQMPVSRVGVMVGGGSLGLGIEELPMKLMLQNQLDLAVCGDITEWTLSAYIRDAAALGMRKGMLVLGHERSEEAGMKYLGEWMKDIVPETEVIFLDAGEPFTYL